MEATQIIKKPIITEKSTWEGDRHGRYSFEVDMRARKPEIRRAIEELYKVRVVKVHTEIRKGTYFRTRFGPGKTTPWKKAAVKIHEDDRIDLF